LRPAAVVVVVLLPSAAKRRCRALCMPLRCFFRGGRSETPADA
jgi:hypothetical protein